MTKLPLRRVAVTGWGALSPGGAGLDAYRRWRHPERGPRSDGMTTARSHVPGFEPAAYIANPKRLRSMHRSFQLIAACSVLAMRDAGLPTEASLEPAGIDLARAGVSTALADLSPLTRDLLEVMAQMPEAPIVWSTFADVAMHHLHPFRRLGLLANMATAHASLLFGLQGPSFTFTTGETGGAQAVTQACWTVAQGRADLMLCQSAESPEQAFAAAPPAEVGGALVLEAWELAERRGAVIHAELTPAADAAPVAEAAHPPPAGRISPVEGLLQAMIRLAEAGTGEPVSLSDLTRPHPALDHPGALPAPVAGPLPAC